MDLLDKAVTKCTPHQRIGAVLHNRYRRPVASTRGTQRYSAHVPTVTKTDRRIHWYRQKDKAVSVHAVEAYIASGGTAPLILNPRY